VGARTKRHPPGAARMTVCVATPRARTGLGPSRPETVSHGSRRNSQAPYGRSPRRPPSATCRGGRHRAGPERPWHWLTMVSMEVLEGRALSVTSVRSFTAATAAIWPSTLRSRASPLHAWGRDGPVAQREAERRREATPGHPGPRPRASAQQGQVYSFVRGFLGMVVRPHSVSNSSKGGEACITLPPTKVSRLLVAGS
jgi:hypothetical protein